MLGVAAREALFVDSDVQQIHIFEHQDNFCLRSQHAEMANQLRPSPLSFDSGRQSPFRRQNSQSPATVRASTPTQSPTKAAPTLSPTKPDSLSPVKNSPFVRRPSQISGNGSGAERPSSPFARPTSSLSIPTSPSRQASNASNESKGEEIQPQSPTRQRNNTPSPPMEDKEDPPTPSGILPQVDGPPVSQTTQAPPPPFPSQANLRPAAHRTVTSSTASTVRQPSFAPTPAPTVTRTTSSAPKLAGAFPTNTGTGAYNHIPNALLRSMRESFEVLDSGNTGSINSASIATAHEQVGLESTHLTSFFPPHGPTNLNLAKYLDVLAAPLAELSSNEELEAAFEAFDRDDSGQIDVAELRKALLMTGPDAGEEDLRMGEREVDGILAEFSGRRAFGAKGLNKLGGGGNGKGEVFRWKEFMSAVRGAGEMEGGVQAEAVMA